MQSSSTQMNPMVRMPLVPWKIGSFFSSISSAAASWKRAYCVRDGLVQGIALIRPLV